MLHKFRSSPGKHMRQRLIGILFIFVCAGPGLLQAQGVTARLLSPEQMKADLDTLRSIMLHTHTDAYAYVSREKLNQAFAEVNKAIETPRTSLEFFRYLNQLWVMLRDVHSRLWLSRRYNDYIKGNGHFLPFGIRYLGGKLFITFDQNDILAPGSEIKSINGIPIEKIVLRLIHAQYSDGNAFYTRIRLMEEDFFWYFPLYFPVHEKNYLVVLSPGNEGSKLIEYPGVQLSQSAKKLKKAPYKQKANKSFRFEMLESNHVAYMKIGSFSAHSDKQYKRFLQQSFEEMNSSNARALIIDIRNNKGGFIDRGSELISYLTEEPFYYIDNSIVRSSKLLKQKIKSGTSMPGLRATFFKKSMGQELIAAWKNDLGAYDTLYWDRIEPQKEKLRFKGQVYLLVNGLSISNAAIVHQVLEKYNLAVTIGEPSGGTSNGTFGHATEFVLPNSMISGRISTIRLNTFPDNFVYQTEPLEPDYLVPDRISHLIDGKDTQLNFTLNLIREFVLN